MIEIHLLKEFGGVAPFASPFGWWAKGHHTADTFCAAIDNASSLPAREPRHEGVRHEWWRCVPLPSGGSVHVDAVPNSRGAFPVTILEFWRCDEALYRGSEAAYA